MKRTIKVMAVAAAMTALSAGTALATSEPIPLTNGTNGADTIRGTAGSDYVEARGGDDRVSGRGGEDILYGGSGRDTLSGGTGVDSLYGGSGRDTLSGGTGVDSLYGGSGGDFIDALTVSGDPANPEGGRDYVRCGAGEDTVVADSSDRVAADCEHVSRGGGDGG